MRFTFFILILLLAPFCSTAQKIGVKTIDPQTLLDVNGSVSFREVSALSLSNGINNNAALDSMSFYRITAPTAAFTITGFANGNNGRLLYLVNATDFDMTLQHQAGSTADNQINIGNGSEVVIAPNGSVTLIYSANASKWVVLGTSGLYLSKTPMGALPTGSNSDDILTYNGSALRKVVASSLSGAWTYIIKPTDEGVTNSNTIQDDDDLVFSADANSTYEIFAQLYVDGKDGHIQYAIDIPSGSLKVDLKQWRDVGSTAMGHEIITADNTVTTETFDVAGIDGITSANLVGIVSVGAPAGTVKLRWSQRSSNGTTTYIRQNSYLKYIKIN